VFGGETTGEHARVTRNGPPAGGTALLELHVGTFLQTRGESVEEVLADRVETENDDVSGHSIVSLVGRRWV
jgi:hypothetical protein